MTVCLVARVIPLFGGVTDSSTILYPGSNLQTQPPIIQNTTETEDLCKRPFRARRFVILDNCPGDRLAQVLSPMDTPEQLDDQDVVYRQFGTRCVACSKIIQHAMSANANPFSPRPVHPNGTERSGVFRFWHMESPILSSLESMHIGYRRYEKTIAYQEKCHPFSCRRRYLPNWESPAWFIRLQLSVRCRLGVFNKYITLY
jgi:hypothetical protein